LRPKLDLEDLYCILQIAPNDSFIAIELGHRLRARGLLLDERDLQAVFDAGDLDFDLARPRTRPEPPYRAIAFGPGGSAWGGSCCRVVTRPGLHGEHRHGTSPRLSSVGAVVEGRRESELPSGGRNGCLVQTRESRMAQPATIAVR